MKSAITVTLRRGARALHSLARELERELVRRHAVRGGAREHLFDRQADPPDAVSADALAARTRKRPTSNRVVATFMHAQLRQQPNEGDLRPSLSVQLDQATSQERNLHTYREDPMCRK